jgi:peptide deformylase
MSEHEHEHEREPVEVAKPQVEETESDPERDAEREARRRIALAQIRQYGDPALRMRAQEVTRFDEELSRTVERMTQLMHDADGIGLAATQVGILRRVFVFSDEGEDRALVNPVITRRSDEVAEDEEGCLSLATVRVPVERAVSVTIEGKDASGAEFRLELAGIAARVVQHELDHLDGKLILDHTDPDSRREALRLLRPRLALA